MKLWSLVLILQPFRSSFQKSTNSNKCSCKKKKGDLTDKNNNLVGESTFNYYFNEFNVILRYANVVVITFDLIAIRFITLNNELKILLQFIIILFRTLVFVSIYYIMHIKSYKSK